MLISELEANLKELREQHGDLPVTAVFDKQNHLLKYVQYRCLIANDLSGDQIKYQWIFISDTPVDLRDFASQFNTGFIRGVTDCVHMVFIDDCCAGCGRTKEGVENVNK